MLTVVATIFAKPDRVDAMKSILQEMALYTKKEDACGLFEVLQDEADGSHFILHEQWASHGGFQAHFKTEHFLRLIPHIMESATQKPETFVLNAI